MWAGVPAVEIVGALMTVLFSANEGGGTYADGVGIASAIDIA